MYSFSTFLKVFEDDVNVEKFIKNKESNVKEKMYILVIGEESIENERIKFFDTVDRYKNAVIFYHRDLDGVASAIYMKTFLKERGYKDIIYIPLNYGAAMFDYPRNILSLDDYLTIVVDFAVPIQKAKYQFDHHIERGENINDVILFRKESRSCVEYMQNVLIRKKYWDDYELDCISRVDSASFSRDDLNYLFFLYDKDIIEEYKKSKDRKNFLWKLILYCNLLILNGKNINDYINNIVANSSTSIISLYMNIIKSINSGLFVRRGKVYNLYDILNSILDFMNIRKKEISDNLIIVPYGKEKEYIDKYVSYENYYKKEKKLEGVFLSFKELGILLQIGMGSMVTKGGYNRYYGFLADIDTEYLIYYYYPLPLIQISYNPFLKDRKTNLNISSIVEETIYQMNLLKNYFVELKYLKYFKSNFNRMLSKFDKELGIQFEEAFGSGGYYENIDLYRKIKDKYIVLSKEERLKLKDCFDQPVNVQVSILNQKNKLVTRAEKNPYSCLEGYYFKPIDILKLEAGGHEKIYNLPLLVPDVKLCFSVVKFITNVFINRVRRIL